MVKLAPYAAAAGLLAGLGIAVTSPRAAAGAGQDLQQAEIGFALYTLAAKSMDITLAVRRGSDSLQVDTAVRTAGLLNFTTRFTMNGQLAARIEDGRYLPSRYVSDSDGTWSKRAIRMTWGADGLPVATVEPPNDEDDREEVPDALKRHTLDPTTAMMARLLQPGAAGAAAGGPPCSGSDAIYDGRRRYNAHYSLVGADTVAPHNRTAYSGPAMKCLMKIQPVAGYTRKFLAEWSEKDEEPLQIWLVQPPGYSAWVPVQLEASSRLGAIRAWISSARLNGRTWLEPLGIIRAELPKENH
jgi:hypothetical protein